MQQRVGGRAGWSGAERGLDGLISCHLDRPNPRVLEECEVRLGKAAGKGPACDLGTQASLVPDQGGPVGTCSGLAALAGQGGTHHRWFGLDMEAEDRGRQSWQLGQGGHWEWQGDWRNVSRPWEG